MRIKVMRHKYTILSALLLVIPFLAYVLWMMYSWMFFDVHYDNDDFGKTLVALLMLCIGSGVTKIANDVE